jgi:EmrB/QacA subfamily drug resistance transporter
MSWQMKNRKRTIDNKQQEKLSPELVKIAFIMVLGMFAPALDSTIVNVAIKTIVIELNSSISVVQWVTTGYILAMGIAVPVSGWLINRFSGKKLYLLTLILFSLSSVLAALSWNIESLIFFRIIQGIGAGIMLPTVQTMLIRYTGGKNMGRLMAVISIPVIIIPILGPVLGGLIVNKLAWQWIFYINVPICIVAILLSQKYLPKDKAINSKQPLDIIGLLLLSFSFSSLIMGISKMRATGSLDSIYAEIPLLAGIVLLIAFVIYSLRTKTAPILDLHLFRFRNFTSSSILLFLSGVITTGTLFILPLYFQQVFHENAFTAGLLLAPQGIGMLITRSLAGKLTDKIGSRLVVAVSLVLVFIGTLPFVFSDGINNLTVLIIALVVRGAGLGGVSIPVMVSIYGGLNKEQVSYGTITARILQQIGGALGTAILAIVLQHQLSLIAGLENTAKAFSVVFEWSMGFTLISIIPSLFLSKKNNK